MVERMAWAEGGLVEGAEEIAAGWSAEERLGLSEQDLLFNAYLDGELTEAQRLAFERRLSEDVDLGRAFDAFTDVMGGLHGLPFEFAPDDFVHKVQSRMRARSQGRFFGEELLYRTRVPYEVLAIVMILVMCAAYLMMEKPTDRNLHGDLTLDPSYPTVP